MSEACNVACMLQRGRKNPTKAIYTRKRFCGAFPALLHHARTRYNPSLKNFLGIVISKFLASIRNFFSQRRPNVPLNRSLIKKFCDAANLVSLLIDVITGVRSELLGLARLRHTASVFMSPRRTPVSEASST